MLMASATRFEPSFSFEKSRPLFRFGGRFRMSGNASAYDVSRDGTRSIVVSQTKESRPSPPQMNNVLNWFEELKRVRSRE